MPMLLAAARVFRRHYDDDASPCLRERAHALTSAISPILYVKKRADDFFDIDIFILYFSTRLRRHFFRMSYNAFSFILDKIAQHEANAGDAPRARDSSDSIPLCRFSSYRRHFKLISALISGEAISPRREHFQQFHAHERMLSMTQVSFLGAHYIDSRHLQALRLASTMATRGGDDREPSSHLRFMLPTIHGLHHRHTESIPAADFTAMKDDGPALDICAATRPFEGWYSSACSSRHELTF